MRQRHAREEGRARPRALGRVIACVRSGTGNVLALAETARCTRELPNEGKTLAGLVIVVAFVGCTRQAPRSGGRSRLCSRPLAAAACGVRPRPVSSYPNDWSGVGIEGGPVALACGARVCGFAVFTSTACCSRRSHSSPSVYCPGPGTCLLPTSFARHARHLGGEGGARAGWHSVGRERYTADGIVERRHVRPRAGRSLVAASPGMGLSTVLLKGAKPWTGMSRSVRM